MSDALDVQDGEGGEERGLHSPSSSFSSPQRRFAFGLPSSPLSRVSSLNNSSSSNKFLVRGASSSPITPSFVSSSSLLSPTR